MDQLAIESIKVVPFFKLRKSVLPNKGRGAATARDRERDLSREKASRSRKRFEISDLVCGPSQSISQS
ncbi:hypothetical protein L6164_006921 [Bauhinia variegata]|uniref:Uncharacterized protein n=1 Tax=Bauhinia variegata TaxID=167791 RepID=A0ACB9PY13_BAUVA|nr:hypothetical protein L6164_006921 [Bauhinia variegata]